MICSGLTRLWHENFIEWPSNGLMDSNMSLTFNWQDNIQKYLIIFEVSTRVEEKSAISKLGLGSNNYFQQLIYFKKFKFKLYLKIHKHIHKNEIGKN